MRCEYLLSTENMIKSSSDIKLKSYTSIYGSISPTLLLHGQTSSSQIKPCIISIWIQCLYCRPKFSILVIFRRLPFSALCARYLKYLIPAKVTFRKISEVKAASSTFQYSYSFLPLFPYHILRRLDGKSFLSRLLTESFILVDSAYLMQLLPGFTCRTYFFKTYSKYTHEHFLVK